MLTKGIKELCKFDMHLMTMRLDDSEKVVIQRIKMLRNPLQKEKLPSDAQTTRE